MALDLGHEGQDVPGGVLGAEDVVLPPLEGREVAAGGGAVQQLGEVLVQEPMGVPWAGEGGQSRGMGGGQGVVL